VNAGFRPLDKQVVRGAFSVKIGTPFGLISTPSLRHPSRRTIAMSASTLAGAAAVGAGARYGMRSILRGGCRFPGSIEGIEVLRNPPMRIDTYRQGVRWATPHQIPLYAPHAPTAPGKPDFADLISTIDQGDNGDCWVLGVVAANTRANPLAMRTMVVNPVSDIAGLRRIARSDEQIARLANAPQSVRQAFEGYVLVNLPHGAKLVRADLPMKNGLPVYAGYTGEALWSAYLEKAFASNAGSYRKLEGGYIGNGFKLLTGKRPKPAPWPASAVGFIKSELDAGRPVAIGTPPQVAEPDTGLFANHVYAVAAVNDSGQVIAFNQWGAMHPNPLSETNIQQNVLIASSDRHIATNYSIDTPGL
jgi:hypothetical protein